MDLNTTDHSAMDNDDDIIDLTDIIEKGTAPQAKKPETIEALTGDLGNVDSPDFQNIVAATNADLDALLEDMEEEIAQKASPKASSSFTDEDVSASAFLSESASVDTHDVVGDNAVSSVADIDAEESLDMPDMSDVDALLASLEIPPQPEDGSDVSVDDDIAGDIDSLFADILNGGGESSSSKANAAVMPEPVAQSASKPVSEEVTATVPDVAVKPKPAPAASEEDFDLDDLEDLLNTVDNDISLHEKNVEVPLPKQTSSEQVLPDITNEAQSSPDLVSMEEVDSLLSEIDDMLDELPEETVSVAPTAAPAPKTSQAPVIEDFESASPPDNTPDLDLSSLDDIFDTLPPIAEEAVKADVVSEKSDVDSPLAEIPPVASSQAEAELASSDIDSLLDGMQDFPVEDSVVIEANIQKEVSPASLSVQDALQEPLAVVASAAGMQQAVSTVQSGAQQTVQEKTACTAEEFAGLTTRLNSLETQQQLFENTQQQLLSRLTTQDVHQRERISALEARLASVYAEEQANIHARVAHVEEKIVNPDIDFSSVQESLEKRLDLLEERFSAFEERIARNVEQTIAKLEERFSLLEERIVQNEAQTIAQFETRFSALEERVVQSDTQTVAQFEERFATLEKRIEQGEQEAAAQLKERFAEFEECMEQNEKQAAVQFEERFSELEARMALNIEQAAAKAAAQIIREEITALLSVADEAD